MKDLIKNKNFNLLMLVQTIEQIGDSLTLMALIAWVMEMPGGQAAANMTILLFWIGVPILLVGPFTGVFIDRVKRKNLLLLSTAMKGTFIFAIFWYVNRPGLVPLLYGLVFMKSFSTQFFIPAKSSYVPSVVNNEAKLIVANSVSATAMVITQIFTYAAAGMMIAETGVKHVLMISSSLYIPAVILIAFINAEENIERKKVMLPVNKILKELFEGYRFMMEDPKIKFVVRRVFFVMIAALTFYIALTGKYIGTIVENTGLNIKYIKALGFMQAVMGFGLVAGVLAIEKILKKIDEMLLIRALFPLIGALIVVLYFVPNFWYLAAFGLVAGMFAVMILSIAETAVQKNSPENMRGRIFAAYYVFRNTGPVIASGLTGVMLRFIQEKDIVLVSGAAFIVYGIINFIGKKRN